MNPYKPVTAVAPPSSQMSPRTLYCCRGNSAIRQYENHAATTYNAVGIVGGGPPQPLCVHFIQRIVVSTPPEPQAFHPVQDACGTRGRASARVRRLSPA